MGERDFVFVRLSYASQIERETKIFQDIILTTSPLSTSSCRQSCPLVNNNFLLTST